MGPAASTGKGTDVEHVYSIMQSIIQLSNSSTSFQTDAETMSCQHEELMTPVKQEDGVNIKYQNDDDDDDMESESVVEKLFLKHLSGATTFFSKRITNFQRLVLNLIQQNMYQQNSNSDIQHDDKDMKELLKFGELRRQIAKLTNNCQDLEEKMVDLAKDRDVAKNSERKVRRGLYRVATGRMKIDEVLKVRCYNCIRQPFQTFPFYSYLVSSQSTLIFM